MANSYTLLADLKAGRCSNTAAVRLLRFWEARNVKKGGELMSLGMLPLDENSTLIQGSVNSVRTIPAELFRFRPYNQLLELANTGKQLPDIIGELIAIRSTITHHIPGAQRVMLTLRLQSGDNVCVSLFDSMALAFHNKFDAYGKEPKVVLATSVNPKIVGDKRGGSNIFLPGHGTEQGTFSSKVVHAQKIEPLTISELNQFIITADSQIIEFLCTAKVTGIQQDDGWCYIGCSGCSKKLLREISSFTCVSCNETNAVASLRYRVTLSVSDKTDTASFLGFDMEMAKLTNIQASETAQIVGIGVDAQVDTELPRSLAEIVGKTYTFQLKLNDFNFTSKHQTFTISRIFPRIFPERELAPMPAFVIPEGENIPDEALPQVVAPGMNARVGTTSNNAEVPSTSDAHVTKRSASTTNQVAPGENDPKKARVE
ncbi:BnaUnng02200D [Brassica napus]|uniref:BnaUnng02200D protein n=1 Tax=Brassica napus TaxID=3708 RepID=A0A078JPY8_BRANA|nr:BnaUnng02200D [Brassica napus]